MSTEELFTEELSQTKMKMFDKFAVDSLQRMLKLHRDYNQMIGIITNDEANKLKSDTLMVLESILKGVNVSNRKVIVDCEVLRIIPASLQVPENDVITTPLRLVLEDKNFYIEE